MKLFLLILLSVMSGCSRDVSSNKFATNGATIPEKVTGNVIDIRYGQTVYHEEFNLEISFDSVSESRCPPEVVCIWAGDAVVSLNVKDLSDQSTHLVKLGIFGALASQSVRVSKYELEILQVNQPREIRDYEAKIQVSEIQ